MAEVKGRVLAAWRLDELLGDTSVSGRFVYIKIVGASDLFALIFVEHMLLAFSGLLDPRCSPSCFKYYQNFQQSTRIP
jgi:hypothetical protein